MASALGPLFSKLAPELRNAIYRAALVEDNQQELGGQIELKVSTLEPRMSLLRTSKQIQAEATSIFWAENTFTIDQVFTIAGQPGVTILESNLRQALRILAHIDKKIAQDIALIRVRIGFSDEYLSSRMALEDSQHSGDECGLGRTTANLIFAITHLAVRRESVVPVRVVPQSADRALYNKFLEIKMKGKWMDGYADAFSEFCQCILEGKV